MVFVASIYRFCRPMNLTEFPPRCCIGKFPAPQFYNIFRDIERGTFFWYCVSYLERRRRRHFRKAAWMSPQEKKKSRVREYNPENIYYQWLNRRQAMPMRINLIFVKYIWIAAVVFILLTYTETWTDPVLEILQIISGFIIFVWPVILLFLCFLVFAPLAVEADSRSSLMEFLYTSPVPSREIVNNLRLYIFKQHFVNVIPALTVLLFLFVESYSKGEFSYIDWDEISTFLMIAAIPALIWWFLLESGVATAGLPKIAYSSGMVFLLWVIPMLVAIFWGGAYLSTWHADFWFRLFGKPIYHDYYDYSSPVSFLDREQWMVVHYDIFLIIVVLITRRLSYQFMACKRVGYWR
jgi:hypothetical protein